MKTNSEIQNNNLVVPTNFDSTAMTAPTHVLITNIELKNGKTAPIITMFNCSEIDFEEVKIGVETTISRNHILENKMKAKQSTLYKMVNGKLDKGISYYKTYFE